MSVQEGKEEHKGPNGFKTTDDAPEVEQSHSWGSWDLFYENISTGRRYSSRFNGGEEKPIEMKEIMYMTKCQEWCGRHYGYIPPSIHKTQFEAFRDAAMARAVERATPIGVTPEEQTAVVVMHILKSQITALISNRAQGLDPVETELCELVTIKDRDYIVIGAQSLYVRIKRWWMDQRSGVLVDQRQVTGYLEFIPGHMQFDKVSGKLDGFSGSNNNKRRSKYAVPMDFVQQYEVS